MSDQANFDALERTALQLRYDLLEMIGVGKAGHLGGSSSLAEVVAVLYFHKLRLNRGDPRDPARDRFLLSKGHAVLIQYAALCELGWFPRSELQRVKCLEGVLQGHPDMSTPGIEAVTGSLGQGLSIGVGMALAFRLDGKPEPRLRRDGGRRAVGRAALGGCDGGIAVQGRQPRRDRRLQQAAGERPDPGRLRHPRHRQEVGTRSAGTSSRSMATTSARSPPRSMRPTR